MRSQRSILNKGIAAFYLTVAVDVIQKVTSDRDMLCAPGGTYIDAPRVILHKEIAAHLFIVRTGILQL